MGRGRVGGPVDGVNPTNAAVLIEEVADGGGIGDNVFTLTMRNIPKWT
jgi:hypothetical protein